ncbi:hypothetical protein F2Q70_00028918 [Brassica cretica]|uniref:Uncharacterized protein n=1 Tax=Brassica cretica TaxID=69181 RepID=A0A8S9ID46_BRACR|nr:hypothetical protein F2Q68_00028481 [Brassica cretica]KAF2602324.1 hypothetical protein F2Q70_00028918 [Brassica cretica]
MSCTAQSGSKLLRGASLTPVLPACVGARGGGVAVSEIVVYGFSEARLRPLSHPFVLFPTLRTISSIRHQRLTLLRFSEKASDEEWKLLWLRSEVLVRFAAAVLFPSFCYPSRSEVFIELFTEAVSVLVEFVQGRRSDFLMICVLIPSPSGIGAYSG